MRDPAHTKAQPSLKVGHAGAACARAQASACLDEALADSSPAIDPPALTARRAAGEPKACAASACADAASNR